MIGAAAGNAASSSSGPSSTLRPFAAPARCSTRPPSLGVWTGARALRIPAFLLRSNAAILIAWLRFARGERITLLESVGPA